MPRWLRSTIDPPMEAQAAYALWAEHYPPRPHNALMEAEQGVLGPLIAQVRAPARALDVGTGTGRYLPLLSATGAGLVVGLDLSMPMLAKHASGTNRVRADGCCLPFGDGVFELVTASLMVGDVEALAPWVSEMGRVLRPGGHLIYSDFHPAWSHEGWQRTFKTREGRMVEVGYWPHTLEAHLAALGAASLQVRTIREPRWDGRKSPLVLVLHAVKGRGDWMALPR